MEIYKLLIGLIENLNLRLIDGNLSGRLLGLCLRARKSVAFIAKDALLIASLTCLGHYHRFNCFLLIQTDQNLLNKFIKLSKKNANKYFRLIFQSSHQNSQHSFSIWIFRLTLNHSVWPEIIFWTWRVHKSCLQILFFCLLRKF